MSRSLLAASGLVLAFTASTATAAPRPVTVYLERNGKVVEHEGEEVEIPRFGGSEVVWKNIVGCVKTHFAPFQVDVVDSQPRTGDFITTVIGGRASLLGMNDRNTNGVGPYIPNRVQRNATVHVFSKVSGEHDAQNLCAVAVHEVAHALGLDHTFKCGDMMSYHLDRCGPRKFLDVEAPCGEFSARVCGDGKRTQNSYRMLVDLVGLRNGTQPPPRPEPAQPQPEPDDSDDEGPEPQQPQPQHDADDGDDSDDEERPRWNGRGSGESVQRYTDRNGRTWVIIRRWR